MEPMFLTTELLRRPGLVHGFSTRHGGVSEGPFASLNLGPNVGDGEAVVAENHERLRRAAGAPDARWATVRQIHGATVLRVDHGPERPWEGGDADALITDQPGWLLGVRTADCVPILIAGPGVVGAVHAGWRGTVARIVVETVTAMESAFGVCAADLTAVIGPAIGLECYQVGPDVVEGLNRALAAGPGGTTGVIAADAGPRVDLVEANRRLLLEAGLPDRAIAALGLCSSCDPRFYSHRRDNGLTGRMLNFIGLVEG